VITLLIDWCARNRFLVFTGTVVLLLAGLWSVRRTPLDDLPDISDVQVIVHTAWNGEPPNIIEDQVTYPIVTALLAAPHVKAVRAQTMFGDSYVFVVFEDGTDLYWARARVLEYLQQIGGRLPAAVHPAIRPDATGAGWIYEYVIIDHNQRYSLADLRSLEDWFLRYQIETVPGVAEVASIGGFVRQYQVRLDPDKLRALSIPLSTVIEKVRDSTNEVGGRLLEFKGAEYMVRGLGYLRSLSELETVPVASKNGTPVLIRDLGTVSFGPDIRRGVAEWNGEGETVGGIVVMRFGMNALNVISGIKKKLAEISGSLPPGVAVVSGYDRSGLIEASIETLKRDLIEEAIIVSLVILIFLFHLRSALIPILTLLIAVIASFIPMYYLQVSSNIMSLGGLALAIGVLVDAAIVMVENGYRHLSEAQASRASGKLGAGGIAFRERQRILLDAAKQVGPALFFSLLIIVVSFLPVFLLEAQEGRMFRPLAWTNIEKLARVVIVTPTNAEVPLGALAKISFSKGPAMIRDEDGALTGYVYLDLSTRDYGGFVARADQLLHEKLRLPAGYSLKWSGEYEFELRAKERLRIILPIVFFTIFLLLYMVFRSLTEALVLIFPTLYAMTGGLLLQGYLGYNFSVAVWVGYIALFGIAVETGVVMVVYLHEALDRRLVAGIDLRRADIEQAAIEGAVQRLRPKLMTVAAVLASLVPILWETGVGSDVMKPIAAPIVGGMITSTINVLILVPVFFVMMKARALQQGKLKTPEQGDE
jgi:Cu/Ag efflux pump CusA